MQIHAAPAELTTNTVAWAQCVVYRALAGMGGSSLTVVGSIILSDCPAQKSGTLPRLFLRGFGAAGGALLGGWLGDTIGWHAAFIIQAPILPCGFLLVFFKIDYADTLSLVGALLTFVVGMNFKTVLGHEWDDIKVWGYLIALAHHGRLDAQVGMSGFQRSKSQLTITISPANTILRLHAQLPPLPAHFLNPIKYAAILHCRCVASGSLFAGWYMRRTGRSARTPEWVLYTTLMPVGLGSAGTLTTTLLALIAGIPPNDILLATGREVFGASLSAAPTQTLLARELRRRIVYDGTDKIIAKILASTAYIDTLPAELQAKATASWMLSPVSLSLHAAYRGASVTRYVDRPAAGKTACSA
ncbi:hypothetical protein B0H14DRAFT_3485125 [Mycena olivaceomarginata]|nr:hypothetical protein B0H14DRAFT_3485125 [Mycena olivaceomarginata]